MTFEGSMVALATAFKNGQVDEAAFTDFVRFQLDHGTEGLIPIGTSGEAVTLSPEERSRVVKLTVETAAGKVPVIAGAGSNSTAETIEGVARVRDAGADGALVVTPAPNQRWLPVLSTVAAPVTESIWIIVPVPASKPLSTKP